MSRKSMARGAALAAVAAVAAAVVLLVSYNVSAIGATSPAGYEPHLNPATFSTHIDNPLFPLPVGRVLVYKGTKDGAPQIDRVTVTRQTIRTAERGIRARAVLDVARRPNGTVIERTRDYYAQSKGAVWYMGEDTVAFEPGKPPDHSGSWHAGVNGAEPGRVMLAHPQIPDAYRQEYLKGQAEDAAWITGHKREKVLGRRRSVLTSLEHARIEPNIVDEKDYAPGLGIVFENSIAGEHETARLVAVH